MTEDEVIRRLRALIAMPAEYRPITLYRLERLAGIAINSVYKIAREGTIGKKNTARLGKAFELVENDQVVVKKNPKATGGSEAATVSIGPVKPPMVIIHRVRFTASGAKIEMIPVNPRAFPVLDPKGK